LKEERVMKGGEPVPGDNIIDSRDLISMYEDLNEEHEDLLANVERLEEEANDLYHKELLEAAREELKEWEEEHLEELETLQAVIEEGESISSEWRHGTTLIHEHYFVDYAMDLGRDIGVISDFNSWPARHIDWEAAAEELKMDYDLIRYGEHRYYIFNA